MHILVFDSQAEAARLWQELADQHGLSVCVEVSWRDIEAVPRECPIVILDQSIQAQGYASLISTLSQVRPNQVIAASGASLTVSEVVQIMRAGVDYVFEKPLQTVTAGNAFREMVEASARLLERQAEYHNLERLFCDLTHREKDVLSYVLEGVSNKEIAEQLDVSIRTIEARRTKLYQKTQSKGVVELVRKVDRMARLAHIFTDPGGQPDRCQKRQEKRGAMLHRPNFLAAFGVHESGASS